MEPQELIAFLEAQHDDGGDQTALRYHSAEFDEAIATAIWGEPTASGGAGQTKTLLWWSGGVGRSLAPKFTTSLDDALMLVPERLSWRVGNLPSGRGFADLGTQRSLQCVEGATPALALCIAALKARQSTNA